ncbi:hypothetical protein [Acaryochloris sp. IP29b_bin.137]|nr:hypothetical protein [Acaryochloris sp. IP29b_bin.137]
MPITFNATTGELIIAGTFNNTLGILDTDSGFNVATHVMMI